MIFKVLNKRAFIGFVSRRELTDIDGKACNNIPEVVNEIVLSDRLDHSCETV
jgi:hypothetical protein